MQLIWGPNQAALSAPKLAAERQNEARWRRDNSQLRGWKTIARCWARDSSLLARLLAGWLSGTRAKVQFDYQATNRALSLARSLSSWPAGRPAGRPLERRGGVGGGRGGARAEFCRPKWALLLLVCLWANRFTTMTSQTIIREPNGDGRTRRHQPKGEPNGESRPTWLIRARAMDAPRGLKWSPASSQAAKREREMERLFGAV